MKNKISSVLPVGNGVGEGPAWDATAEKLVWADITGRSVHRMHPGTREIQTWHALDFPCFGVPTRSGRLLVGLRDGVYWLDQFSGAMVPFARPEAESRPGNRSNEGKVDHRGRLWLGTMESNLNLDGSKRAIAQSSGALYCINGAGESTLMLDGIGISNTLAWVPDQATMYFGDSLANEISRYALDADALRIVGKEPFQVDKPPGFCDGSALDLEGRLWNARFGAGMVVRFTASGTVDCVIPLPVTNPTSCCFGGSDLRTLYVTSARFGLTGYQLAQNPIEGALIAIDVDTPGAIVPPFED